MDLAALLQIPAAFRLSRANEPDEAVEFTFKLAPKESEHPDGPWTGVLGIVVQNVHNAKEVGAAFVERAEGPTKADVVTQLLKATQPFRNAP